MPAKICTHINVTGVRCGSPALHGARFCYYHQRVHRGVPEPRNSRLHPIAQLDSPEAIQASLMEVLNAIVRNDIDLKRAGLLIRGLHIASKNIHRVYFNIHTSEMVRDVPQQPAEPSVDPMDADPFNPDPVQQVYQIPFSDSAVVQQTVMNEEVIRRYEHKIRARADAFEAKRRKEEAEAAAAAAAAAAAENTPSAPSTPPPTPPPAPELMKPNPVPAVSGRKPPASAKPGLGSSQAKSRKARTG